MGGVTPETLLTDIWSLLGRLLEMGHTTLDTQLVIGCMPSNCTIIFSETRPPQIYLLSQANELKAEE